MRTIRRVLGMLIPAALVVLWSSVAAAQGGTQLTVTVTDPMGARVPNAAVVISNLTETRSEVTDGDGAVIVRGLATGAWTLEVARDGFQTVRRPVVVQATPVTANVVLELGGVRTNVTVTAARPEDALQLDGTASGGTRLDIPLRELPASLTVITQDLMQERGINSVMDATELSPGVTTFIDSGSIPGINVRGFSSTSGAVSITRDGIRQNTLPQSARPLDAFMLDRVEVLKGPASLMSGEGATGASINYKTKDPRRHFEVDALIGFGSFDKYRAGLGVSIPMTRKLSGRFDYVQADGGGYVERTGDKMQSAVAALLYVPTPNLSLKARGVWAYDHVRSYYGTPIIDGVIDPRTRYLNYNMRDPRNVATNNYGHLDADFVLGGWTLHNGFFAATQDVIWRNYESTQFVPATRMVQVGSYFLAGRDDLLLGNQIDARKSFSVAGRTINFVAGYQVQDNDQERYTGPPTSAAFPNPTRLVDPYTPAPIFDPGYPLVFNRNVKVNTHTVFGEAQVALHEQFKVVTGLRVEQFDVLRNQVDVAPVNGSYTPATGRLGAVYLPSPLVSFYGSYSRAVEPTTPLVSITVNPATSGTCGTDVSCAFSLQPSTQYEFGTKSTFLAGRLDATAAYFNISKENILTSTIIDNVRVQQQIGEQRSRGFELSLVGRPYQSLQVMGDVTFLQPQYVEFNENSGTGIIPRSGNTVPHYAGSVWNLTPMQSIGPVTVSATIRRVGARWRDNANTLRLPAYTTTQLNLSSRFYHDARITLTVRNLTDELYIPRSNSDVTGRVAAPRHFEVTITKVWANR
jgi:iron complex outermembrane receptor protein